MYKFLILIISVMGIMSAANAKSTERCNVVKASMANIKAVAKSYGAQSVITESTQGRSVDPSVSFSFVDSKGQLYIGVNQVDDETCKTVYYNIQKAVSVSVD